MALSKPNLSLIPSAKKAGKLYSPIPLNGDGDFTFARASVGTFTNKDGYLETAPIDVPRLDYRDTDGSLLKCPQLLLEPAAQNRVPFSHNFGGFSGSNSTAENNSTISPSGFIDATKLSISDSIPGNVSFNDFGLIDTDLDNVQSVFVKKGTAQYIRLMNGSRGVGVVFDLFNNTLFNINGNADDYGYEKYNDGWYRIWFSELASGGGLDTFSLSIMQDINTSSWTEAPAGQYVYIYGPQSEEGLVPSSYIENTTSGVSLRGDDICYGAGTIGTFNSSEGVLYAEISGRQWNGADALLTISDGTTSNRIYLRYSSSNFLAAIIIATTIEVIFSTPLASLGEVTDMNKIAIKYKQNDCALWINGVEVLSDLSTSALFPSGTLTTFGFNSGSGSNRFYGRVKNIKVYDTALTDEELTELTQ